MSRWDNKDMLFSVLVGKTLTEIKQHSLDNDAITFVCNDGTEYLMTHYQDCCENVGVEDITGDLEDLIGNPVLVAEERTNRNDGIKNDDESSTWTFYELATIKGSVTIRWYGSSNGCYSEGVSFELINKDYKYD